ncbi:MAG TPA: ATP-binding protein [Pyrinomonadaceae bacterium]|nr:ATP-binding protein [Pyrinomonadaceae bacterium]
MIDRPFNRSPAPGSNAPSDAAFLHGIINAHRDAVLVIEPSLRISAANNAAIDAFGQSDIPLAGKRMSEVIRDVALHTALKRALDGGKITDLRIELAGGSLRKYDVHVAPIEGSQPARAIAVFYDITKVERLERVRQEFLSNISHELRTPLTSILAFVETLEDGAIDDPENNRRFLSTIRRNAERMHALIADILELSLIESGNISIEKGEVRVAHIVDEVFASLSSKAAAREISLINEINSTERIYADPMRLEQMLTNLIDNAVKFNRSAGEIVVSLEHRTGRDRLSVSDTGEGITAAHLPRIFERFYRVDRGRSREVGGTGLGLAIVKHLARLHGGEISIASTLGVGTTFTIELPSCEHLPAAA